MFIATVLEDKDIGNVLASNKISSSENINSLLLTCIMIIKLSQCI